MHDPPVSILLMDDEPTSAVILATIKRLEQEGFNVHVVETIATAVQAYYERYYDVFILDIDMSRQPDSGEGDGIKVLRRFISLHNQTRVIMYSAAGKSPHWVKAANAHCYAYVHKNEKNAMENLVAYVRKSLEEPPMKQWPKKRAPRNLLLYAQPKDLEAKALAAAEQSLGWPVQISDTLSDMAQALSKTDEYGAAVVLQPHFKLRTEVRKLMDLVLACSPVPHVVVGCKAVDDHQSSILYIANRHPFRLIHLGNESWPERLEEALVSARTWYGRREIFPADPEALKRLDIHLPKDELDEWVGIDEEDLDEGYDGVDAYNDDPEGQP